MRDGLRLHSMAVLGQPVQLSRTAGGRLTSRPGPPLFSSLRGLLVTSITLIPADVRERFPAFVSQNKYVVISP